MVRPNRRCFLSSLAFGGAAGLSGCTDISNHTQREFLDEDEDENENENEDEDIEEMRITGMDIDSSGFSNIEISFSTRDFEGDVFQEQVDLVVQVMPHEYVSPEVDNISISYGEDDLKDVYATPEKIEVNDDSEITTVDKITIAEEGDRYPTRSTEIDIEEYWDDLPGKNEYAFGILFGIEAESQDETEVLGYSRHGYIVYTHRENGSEERNISSSGRRHIWTEDGKQHFVFVFGLSQGTTASTMYNSSEYLGTMPVVMKYSIDLDTMRDLDKIYENDPLAWQDYLETRSGGSLSGIKYLDRPIFAVIAETIETGLERYKLTEVDDYYVGSANSMISTAVSYGQTWDEVGPDIRVPYPEILFREEVGDCKAQGFAVNGVLHHLGYDTCLFLFRKDDADFSFEFHHLSGGVGMDLNPEKSGIGDRVERTDGTYTDSEGIEREGRWKSWRHPEFSETDERSEKHIKVDPTTSIGGYSPKQSITTYHFVEGKGTEDGESTAKNAHLFQPSGEVNFEREGSEIHVTIETLENVEPTDIVHVSADTGLLESELREGDTVIVTEDDLFSHGHSTVSVYVTNQFQQETIARYEIED